MNLKKEKNLAQTQTSPVWPRHRHDLRLPNENIREAFFHFLWWLLLSIDPKKKKKFINFKINVMSNKVANWSWTDRMWQQCIGWTNKPTVYQRMGYVFHARRARCFSRLSPFNQLIYSSIIKLNKFLIKVQQASNATTQSSECDDFNLSATEFLVIDG